MTTTKLIYFMTLQEEITYLKHSSNAADYLLGDRSILTTAEKNVVVSNNIVSE